MNFYGFSIQTQKNPGGKCIQNAVCKIPAISFGPQWLKWNYPAKELFCKHGLHGNKPAPLAVEQMKVMWICSWKKKKLWDVLEWLSWQKNHLTDQRGFKPEQQYSFIISSIVWVFGGIVRRKVLPVIPLLAALSDCTLQNASWKWNHHKSKMANESECKSSMAVVSDVTKRIHLHTVPPNTQSILLLLQEILWETLRYKSIHEQQHNNLLLYF